MTDIHPMWQQYPSILKDLEATYSVMEKEIRIRNKEIEKTIDDMIHAGGKLLRPAYFILFSRFGKPVAQKKLLYFSASLEILHMATLIHDDVIDDSPTRRGQITVQEKYSNQVAIYAGDFLFTVYFDLLAKASEDFSYIHLNAYSMRKLLIGELDQMHLNYNIKITVKEYLRKIGGKTAQLFALSCAEGAKIAHANPRIMRLAYQTGFQIGMAFQMLDDILDYSSDEDTFKKPVLEDIRQGVYSLPLILAMQNHLAEFAPYLDKKTDMSEEDVQAVVTLIRKYNGIEQAYVIAEKYTDKALNNIQKLPDQEEKTILIALTEKLLNRTM